MTTTLTMLIAVLAVWILLCAWCGYRARFILFTAVMVVGWSLNAAWMVAHLNADPLEYHALIAQGSISLYGLCAFAFGWIAGRIARQWDARRLENT